MLLCGYSDLEALEMYDLVIRARSKRKDRTACDRAMNMICHRLVARFGERLDWAKDGKTVKMRPAEVDEPEAVKRYFSLLMPPLAEPPRPAEENPFLASVLPILQESFAEVKHMYQFFDARQFNELATAISDGGSPGTFEDRLRIPDIKVPTALGPAADSRGLDLSAKPDFDLDQLTSMIDDYRDRRQHIAPGTLRIRVDDVERGTLDMGQRSFGALFEEGAGLVEVVGHDQSGEPVTLAAYILTYDSPKAECWDANLGKSGTVRMDFEYRDDDTVSAVFSISSEHVESAWTLADEENSNADTLSNAGQGSADPDIINQSDWNTDSRQSVLGECGSGKTRVALARLLRCLMDRGDRILSLWPGEHSDDIVDHLRYVRVLMRHLCDRPKDENVERSIAGAWAKARYRPLRQRTAAFKAEEIDKLVARQATEFDEFLARAEARGLTLGSVPSIHEPDERRSRTFGALAIISAVCEGVGFVFSGDLVNKLGPSVTTLTLIIPGLATFLAGRMWWNFGWSLRLYRKYYQAEHSIALLRADLTGDRRTDSKDRVITDWRSLPFARTLGILLQSTASRHSDDYSSWTANSASQNDLIAIVGELGGERRAQPIARAIISARPIKSASDLAHALSGALKLPDAVANVWNTRLEFLILLQIRHSAEVRTRLNSWAPCLPFVTAIAHSGYRPRRTPKSGHI